MAMTQEQILEALATVRYPGTGHDLVASGMVDEGSIAAEGGNVRLTLLFDKATDPFIKSVVRAAEAAIERAGAAAGEAVEVRGHITARSRQAPPPEPEQLLPGVKNIIAVASGKGGVGKSTVAANLAVGLSMLGYRVGLLDADVFGPSAPKMFGLEQAQVMAEHRDGRDLIIPLEQYGVKVLSVGFFVDPASATIWRGSMAGSALRQLIADADWGELDYFLIDLPPGTSDIHLTLVQTLAITGAVIVSTPQEVALADARKGIDMFRNEKVGVPILGLVENMAWFTPAELPDHRYYLFGREGVVRLAEQMKLPLLAQIPVVQSVCEAGDGGTPAVLDYESMVGQSFLSLAQAVVTQVNRRNAEQPPTQRVEVAKGKK